ncbi:hypothetical protein SCB49_06497 [unidentified eubacterium SCB49]|nr:hypothetical protein SCB49_06497 [unidentified eubacterium SCB49]
MKIWTRIRKLSIRQLWKFSILFLKHPLLIIPTIRATKRTFEICNDHFGNAHHKSNTANAFRHALWNVLICKNTLKSTKNKQKSVFWAQKVSDLYENVTQNKPIEQAMDLHNNAVGRIYFLNLLDKEEQEIIAFTQDKMKSAKKVNDIVAMKQYQNEMVFLVE